MAKDRMDFQASSTAGRSKRILLAEDDADIRFILNTVLNEAGYDVEPLPDGNTIVEERCEWPDLFILDKALPTTDGLAICEYLKINENTKDIPIIMISCYHEFRMRAKRIGVDQFIVKPFDLKVLLQSVDNMMRDQERKA